MTELLIMSVKKILHEKLLMNVLIIKNNWKQSNSDVLQRELFTVLCREGKTAKVNQQQTFNNFSLVEWNLNETFPFVF